MWKCNTKSQLYFFITLSLNLQFKDEIVGKMIKAHFQEKKLVAAGVKRALLVPTFSRE